MQQLVAAIRARRAGRVVAETINLGNKITVYQTNKVTNQYGPQGALGDFVTVLESPNYGQDGQISQFNVQTWLGAANLPSAEIEERRLALLGKLTWGIGGATFQADFDWKIGNQLSFAASFFRVDIAFSEVGEGSPDSVTVGAMHSSGGRASRSQVTRTYPKVPVGTSLFPIPPFAHALYLFADDPDFYGDDEGVPNATIRYVGGASSGYSAISTDLESFVTGGAPFLAALSNEDGVRFPEAARVVEIVAAGGLGPWGVTPTFTLNF